jgi:superfamily II DNA or RNA helicase
MSALVAHPAAARPFHPEDVIDLTMDEDEKKEEEEPLVIDLVGDDAAEEADAREEEDRAAFAADPVGTVARRSRMPLTELQVGAVRQLQGRHGLMLAWSTGKGKTLAAVLACEVERQRAPDLHVMVIAPLSLHDNFQRNLDRFGVDPEGQRHYTYHTYEGFYNAWVLDPAIADGAFLVLDEAHHARTEIIPATRIKVKQRVKKIQKLPERERRACDLNLVRRAKELVAYLSSTSRASADEHHDVLGYCRTRFAVDLGAMGLVPRSMAVVEAARAARRVLLMSATPCFNTPEDMTNYYCMLTGEPAMGRFRARELAGNPDRARAAYGAYFSHASVAYGDPAFARVSHTVVRVPMTDEYYRKYHAIEEKAFADPWAEPWTFLAGVRTAADGLDGNSKAEAILERVIANPVPTIIYSTFITHGVKRLQALVRAAGIRYETITGEEKADDRAAAIVEFNAGRVRVLFISDAGSEGVDPKGVRAMHLYETSWNQSRRDQVRAQSRVKRDRSRNRDQTIGRGPRYMSHSHLPEAERTVDVYEYILIKPEVRMAGDHFPQSSDEMLHAKTLEKDRVIKAFMRRFCM